MHLRWAAAVTVALAAVALAAPAPSRDRQSPLAKLKPNHISAELFDEFDELARINDVAYCVGTLNTGVDSPFQCLSYCKDFPDFELIQTWNTGITVADSCGFIALSHSPSKPRIIVAFRGTYSITNALSDMTVVQQEYTPYPSKGHGISGDKCEGCMVHVGFLRSWTVTEEIIGDVVAQLVQDYPDYELVLVGHSLGGAVAALAGLDFEARGWKPTVTTFGEPRVGNKPLAGFINKKFTSQNFRRVTHEGDPVPLVPLTSMGYESHAHEYYISANFLPYKPKDVHLCSGNADPECIARDYINAFAILWSHRDYFHRMGLCVPHDFSWWFGGSKLIREPDVVEPQQAAPPTGKDIVYELKKRDGMFSDAWYRPWHSLVAPALLKQGKSPDLSKIVSRPAMELQDAALKESSERLVKTATVLAEAGESQPPSAADVEDVLLGVASTALFKPWEMSDALSVSESEAHQRGFVDILTQVQKDSRLFGVSVEVQPLPSANSESRQEADDSGLEEIFVQYDPRNNNGFDEPTVDDETTVAETTVAETTVADEPATLVDEEDIT